MDYRGQSSSASSSSLNISSFLISDSTSDPSLPESSTNHHLGNIHGNHHMSSMNMNVDSEMSNMTVSSSENQESLEISLSPSQIINKLKELFNQIGDTILNHSISHNNHEDVKDGKNLAISSFASLHGYSPINISALRAEFSSLILALRSQIHTYQSWISSPNEYTRNSVLNLLKNSARKARLEERKKLVFSSLSICQSLAMAHGEEQYQQKKLIAGFKSNSSSQQALKTSNSDKISNFQDSSLIQHDIETRRKNLLNRFRFIANCHLGDNPAAYDEIIALENENENKQNLDDFQSSLSHRILEDPSQAFRITLTSACSLIDIDIDAFGKYLKVAYNFEFDSQNIARWMLYSLNKGLMNTFETLIGLSFSQRCQKLIDLQISLNLQQKNFSNLLKHENASDAFSTKAIMSYFASNIIPADMQLNSRLTSVENDVILLNKIEFEKLNKLKSRSTQNAQKTNYISTEAYMLYKGTGWIGMGAFCPVICFYIHPFTLSNSIRKINHIIQKYHDQHKSGLEDQTEQQTEDSKTKTNSNSFKMQNQAETQKIIHEYDQIKDVLQENQIQEASMLDFLGTNEILQINFQAFSELIENPPKQFLDYSTSGITNYIMGKLRPDVVWNNSTLETANLNPSQKSTFSSSNSSKTYKKVHSKPSDYHYHDVLIGHIEIEQGTLNFIQNQNASESSSMMDIDNNNVSKEKSDTIQLRYPAPPVHSSIKSIKTISNMILSSQVIANSNPSNESSNLSSNIDDCLKKKQQIDFVSPFSKSKIETFHELPRAAFESQNFDPSIIEQSNVIWNTETSDEAWKSEENANLPIQLCFVLSQPIAIQISLLNRIRRLTSSENTMSPLETLMMFAEEDENAFLQKLKVNQSTTFKTPQKPKNPKSKNTGTIISDHMSSAKENTDCFGQTLSSILKALKTSEQDNQIQLHGNEEVIIPSYLSSGTMRFTHLGGEKTGFLQPAHLKISRIPFSHLSQLQPILSILRQQTIITSLYNSIFDAPNCISTQENKRFGTSAIKRQKLDRQNPSASPISYYHLKSSAEIDTPSKMRQKRGRNEFVESRNEINELSFEGAQGFESNNHVIMIVEVTHLIAPQFGWNVSGQYSSKKDAQMKMSDFEPNSPNKKHKANDNQNSDTVSFSLNLHVLLNGKIKVALNENLTESTILNETRTLEKLNALLNTTHSLPLSLEKWMSL